MRRIMRAKTAYLCFFVSTYGIFLPILGCGGGYVEGVYIQDDLNAISRKLQEEDKEFESCTCDLQTLGDPNFVIMGLPRRTIHMRLSAYDIKMLPRRALTVPVELILEAQYKVPEQNDKWSCGINSAARFAAMLGKKIKNYDDFLKGAPHYGGFLLPEIGVNPEGIQNYLQARANLSPLAVSQTCTRVFHPHWQAMLRSLSLGWPTMSLIMNSGTSLHWLNIVARDKISGNWIYLNTDGFIYEIPGGDEALKSWMNHGNCAAQRFNFVERFNSVSATYSRSNPHILAGVTHADAD